MLNISQLLLHKSYLKHCTARHPRLHNTTSLAIVRIATPRTVMRSMLRVRYTRNMHCICMYVNERQLDRCYWPTCCCQRHSSDVTSEVIKTEERTPEAVSASDEA